MVDIRDPHTLHLGGVTRGVGHEKHDERTDVFSLLAKVVPAECIQHGVLRAQESLDVVGEERHVFAREDFFDVVRLGRRHEGLGVGNGRCPCAHSSIWTRERRKQRAAESWHFQCQIMLHKGFKVENVYMEHKER